MSFDPVSEDPPGLDPGYPAALAEVGFVSHGSLVNGVLLIAEGPGPHPTALVLHGFPGYERNLDLAQALRRAGWNALVFHYRGAWGSQGDYSFGHVLEDVHQAIGFVRSEGREANRCDPDRIALIGHSLGGFATLMTLAARDDLLGGGSIAGFSLGAVARQASIAEDARDAALRMFEEELRPLQGATAEALFAELLAHGDEWDPATYAEALSRRAVLLLAGLRDDAAPPEIHHDPLVATLEDHRPKRFRHMLLDTDHAFSDKRVTLARLMAEWLGGLLSG